VASASQASSPRRPHPPGRGRHPAGGRSPVAAGRPVDRPRDGKARRPTIDVASIDHVIERTSARRGPSGCRHSTGGRRLPLVNQKPRTRWRTRRQLMMRVAGATSAQASQAATPSTRRRGVSTSDGWYGATTWNATRTRNAARKPASVETVASARSRAIARTFSSRPPDPRRSATARRRRSAGGCRRTARCSGRGPAPTTTRCAA